MLWDTMELSFVLLKNTKDIEEGRNVHLHLAPKLISSLFQISTIQQFYFAIQPFFLFHL